MRKFFEDFKTLVAELVGLIGGFFWARSTNWDYEPLILMAVSVVGLIISLLLFFIKEKKSKILSTSNIGEGIITDIKPEIIKRQIQSVPMFQREDIAKHFVGLKVQWPLKLFLIHKRNNNEIKVVMVPIDGPYVSIRFVTTTLEHPIFKIAEDNKKFMVYGKIIKCTEYDIDLDIITLKEL